jgi:hypothetical protein
MQIHDVCLGATALLCLMGQLVQRLSRMLVGRMRRSELGAQILGRAGAQCWRRILRSGMMTSRPGAGFPK